MKKAALILLLALLALTAQAFAGSYTIDFEGLPDGTLIDNNYSSLAVIFQNAAIATAGITLNEFDFPPHSGVNVAFDALGPIALLFTTPISSFSAYFTYTELLTLTGYNAGHGVVGTASSLFTSNYVSSGNPPNELIGLTFLGGISSITIAADPLGNSFTMDDASVTQLPVPEPGVLYLLVPPLVLIGLFEWRWRIASNEFLEVSFPSRIASVILTGDPLGGSFTLDDATYTITPEPSTISFLLAGTLAIVPLRKRLIRVPKPSNNP